MPKPIALFASHYSYLHSLLTLEEAGRTPVGGPRSIVDLAREHHLKQVILVDEKIDGFLEAHKNLSKPFKPVPPRSYDDYLREAQGDKKAPDDKDRAKAQTKLDEATAKHTCESEWARDPIQLIYGVKLCVCADITDKTEASLKTESNVIIFIRSSQGYSDLIRLYNRAWTDGFYYQGRTDWRALKALWTDNLALALPTYSSFIFKNQMTFSNIVPDLPARPTVFREMDSGLPFAPIVDRAITSFAEANGLTVQPVKSIYYAGPEDYDSYTVFRAIGNRSEFGRPNVDHMCSDSFSFKDYLRLTSHA